MGDRLRGIPAGGSDNGSGIVIEFAAGFVLGLMCGGMMGVLIMAIMVAGNRAEEV